MSSILFGLTVTAVIMVIRWLVRCEVDPTGDTSGLFAVRDVEDRPSTQEHFRS